MQRIGSDDSRRSWYVSHPFHAHALRHVDDWDSTYRSRIVPCKYQEDDVNETKTYKYITQLPKLILLVNQFNLEIMQGVMFMMGDMLLDLTEGMLESLDESMGMGGGGGICGSITMTMSRAKRRHLIDRFG